MHIGAAGCCCCPLHSRLAYNFLSSLLRLSCRPTRVMFMASAGSTASLLSNTTYALALPRSAATMPRITAALRGSFCKGSQGGTHHERTQLHAKKE